MHIEIFEVVVKGDIYIHKTKMYSIHQKYNPLKERWLILSSDILWMFIKIVINQAGQKRGVHHDVDDTSMIQEFLIINPL